MKDRIIPLWFLWVVLTISTPSVILAEEPAPPEALPSVESASAEPAPMEQKPALSPSSPSSPSFDALLKSGQINTFKVDHGIQRSDAGASYLLLQAEEAMARGSLTEAERWADAAVELSPSSPVPHFFLSYLVWVKSKTDLPGMAGHYMTALQLAIGDFWFSHSFAGTLFILSLSAILLALMTFLLFSFFAYSPLWIHKINEGSRGYFHPIAAGLFFTGILLIPFVLGLSILWFIVISFLIFWGFYSRSEKGIALVFLVVIGISAWSLPLLLTFFTAKNTMLNQMVRNYQEDFFWSPPGIDPAGSDWRGAVINASYEAQKGDYRRAESFYQKALAEQPGSPMILNNLGNIAFYLKEYPRAIDLYRQALVAAPGLVSAHYNMSLAYREMLSFEEGNREYGLAKGMDAGRVEDYTRKSVLFPTLPLINEQFSRIDLWREALIPDSKHLAYAEKIWQGVAGKIPLHRSPMLALLWLFALALSSLLFERFYNASFCIICHKAICKKCQKNILSYRVCGPCGTQFKSIRRSDLALLEAEEKKVARQLIPFFLLPGGGHLVMKRAGIGFIFLALFFLPVSYLLFGEVLFSSTHWHLQSAKWVWASIFIFFLYAVSALDLMRIWSNESWR